MGGGEGGGDEPWVPWFNDEKWEVKEAREKVRLPRRSLVSGGKIDLYLFGKKKKETGVKERLLTRRQREGTVNAV